MFIVIILFAGRHIACEIGVPKVFIIRILFASRPIACEMGFYSIINSIEHGGTGTFSNMCYFCWIFCVTILRYFCVGLLVVGGVYMVPLGYDNGMVPR